VERQIYRIFQCPRCKNLEWGYTKEKVGTCKEWKQDVVQLSDPLTQHLDQCKYFEQGKPTNAK
jgi:hypothetical protein